MATIVLNIPDSDIESLLDSAIHGAHYWASMEWASDTHCAVTERETLRTVVIGPAQMLNGLILAYSHAPKVFGRVMSGPLNYDVSDAEIILQLAVLGEVTYG